jgi:hypothetical protein
MNTKKPKIDSLMGEMKRDETKKFIMFLDKALMPVDKEGVNKDGLRSGQALVLKDPDTGKEVYCHVRYRTSREQNWTFLQVPGLNQKVDTWDTILERYPYHVFMIVEGPPDNPTQIAIFPFASINRTKYKGWKFGDMKHNRRRVKVCLTGKAALVLEFGKTRTLVTSSDNPGYKTRKFIQDNGTKLKRRVTKEEKDNGKTKRVARRSLRSETGAGK